MRRMRFGAGARGGREGCVRRLCTGRRCRAFIGVSKSAKEYDILACTGCWSVYFILPSRNYQSSLGFFHRRGFFLGADDAGLYFFRTKLQIPTGGGWDSLLSIRWFSSSFKFKYSFALRWIFLIGIQTEAGAVGVFVLLVLTLFFLLRTPTSLYFLASLFVQFTLVWLASAYIF